MKINKLGIPIVDDKYKNNKMGNSINIYTYNPYIIVYFRVFRSRNPYFNNLYGIHIRKNNHLYGIYINKTHHNVHNK